jgi:hypothetical protein
VILGGAVGVRNDDLALGLGAAISSTIGSTVVIPAPALASRSGMSDGCTTKSPAGALTLTVSPGWR